MLEAFEVNEKVIARTTNRLYKQAISGVVVEITKSGNYKVKYENYKDYSHDNFYSYNYGIYYQKNNRERGGCNRLLEKYTEEKYLNLVKIPKMCNIIRGFFNSSVNLQSLINNGEDGVKVLEDVYLIIENYKNKQKKD